jgi:glycosyltransferase involved in cell wall biosynthesis
MRFAVYHPWVHLFGGIERMLMELLKRSRHDWTLYTHYYPPDGTFDDFRALPIVELHPTVSVERSLMPLADAAWKISRARLPDADGLLVSTDGFGDLILSRNHMPAAAYCHTPLRILHEPTTREALRQRDAAKARILSLIGPAFGLVDRRMWKRYRHVFVSSVEVRTRAERAKLSPAGPIEILPYGVDLEWFSDDGRKRDDFFLFVGRIKWWKRVELAVEAISELVRRGASPRLVIAGTADPTEVDYLDRLRAKATGLPVEFETTPTQEKVQELYRSCRALVFTSHSEDFGIVPLEAMACGAPVIAVNSGGPRETVIPGVSGWHVPPTAEAFADAMLEALGGRAEDMRAGSRMRAMEYTWERFVGRIDDVMEEIATARTQVMPS